MYTTLGERGEEGEIQIALHSVALNTGENIVLDEGAIDAEQPFIITPDGQRVIYLKGGQAISVPIYGGSTQELGSCVHLQDVTEDYVLCLEPAGYDNYNLYSVPLEPGEPIRLNPRETVVLGTSGRFIETNGRQVVFGSYNQRNGMYYVQSVPLAGGDAVTLAGPNDHYGLISYYVRYLMAPDGNDLFGVFAGDRIFRVNIETGQTTVIANQSNVIGNDDNDITTDVAIDPTGSWLVFVVSNDGGVYRVNLGSGAIRQLDNIDTMDWGNGLDVSQNSVAYVEDGSRILRTATLSDGEPGLAISGANVFRLSPDGSRLAYITSDMLFSAPVTGGDATQLTSQGIKDFGFAPNSSQLVYLLEDVEGYSLFAIPTTGGEAVKLNQVPGSRRINFTGRFTITADSENVIYTLDEETVGQLDIYLVPIQGGSPTRLTEAGYYRMALYPPGSWGIVS